MSCLNKPELLLDVLKDLNNTVKDDVCPLMGQILDVVLEGIYKYPNTVQIQIIGLSVSWLTLINRMYVFNNDAFFVFFFLLSARPFIRF